MKRRIPALLASVLCLSCAAVGAHHAPSIYDLTRRATVTGTVIAFDWQQPHTWTTVAGVDSTGRPDTWRLEGMNPSYLGRRGWTRYTLKPGDAIEVRFYPRKDGTSSGLFLEATLADGTVRVMAIGPAPPADDVAISGDVTDSRRSSH